MFSEKNNLFIQEKICENKKNTKFLMVAQMVQNSIFSTIYVPSYAIYGQSYLTYIQSYLINIQSHPICILSHLIYIQYLIYIHSHLI